MDWIHDFVASLGGLDRGALAELRRSLAFEPGTYPPAYPYVERYVAHSHDRERRWFYLLAGLYSLERSSGGTGAADAPERTLGASVVTLFGKRGQIPSIEQRFIVLLDADDEQLPHRLRQMVTLLRSEAIPIHWAQLLRDLLAWSHPHRYVQQRWARDFYGSAAESSESTTEKGVSL